MSLAMSAGGKRYTDDVLQIRYKGKNIADVLDMTAEEALEFFKAIPRFAENSRLSSMSGSAI